MIQRESSRPHVSYGSSATFRTRYVCVIPVGASSLLWFVVVDLVVALAFAFAFAFVVCFRGYLPACCVLLTGRRLSR